MVEAPYGPIILFPVADCEALASTNLRQRQTNDGIHGTTKVLTALALVIACVAFFGSLTFCSPTRTNFQRILGQVAMLRKIFYFPSYTRTTCKISSRARAPNLIRSIAVACLVEK